MSIPSFRVAVLLATTSTFSSALQVRPHRSASVEGRSGSLISSVIDGASAITRSPETPSRTGPASSPLPPLPPCPCAGNPPEGEANCGLPVDTFNGGCNSTPPVFSSIAPGGSVCGTAAWDGTTRDTDCYQFSLPVPCVITWTVTAEYPVVTALLDNNCPANILDFDVGAPCVPTSSTGLLPVGTYIAFTAPDFSGPPLPCAGANSYTGTLTCSPPAPGDDSCTPIPIVGKGPFTFDNTTATTGIDGQSNSICNFYGTPGITNDIWYLWTSPITGTVEINLCGQTSMDSKVAVYCGGCCPPGDAIACNDDSCGLQSVVTFPVCTGGQYLIQLGNYPSATPGTGTFFLTCEGSAGDLDSLGTDFLLAAQLNYNGGDVSLHFAATAAATVTVEYPLGTLFSTTSLAAGTGATVDVGTAPASDWTPDTIAQHVIHVSSTSPISLHMTNYLHFTVDGAMALPSDALGTEYIVADYDSLVGFTRFTLFARDDNTTVTITPTVNLLGGHPAGAPFTIALNRGDGYQGQSAAGGAGSSLSGTVVEADKPIGLTNGADCADVPNGTGACDTVFEIAQPVSSWARSVIVTNLPQRPSGSVYRVLGSQNTTTWTLDGVTQSPALNRGGFVDIGPVAGNHVISADAPIFVEQFMTGAGSAGAVGGDPSMCNMIPWLEYCNTHTFFVPTVPTLTTLYVTIIAENADTSTLKLDGSAIGGAGGTNFTAIPGSGFSVYSLVTSTGKHTTLSNGLHGITIEGYGITESFAYPVGARFMESHCPCPPQGEIVSINIAGSPPTVSPKSAVVNPGDVVQWLLPNGVAHACDSSPLIATTLIVSFINADPTVGAWNTTAPIAPSAGADTNLWVQLQNPLAGSYGYTIKILDQYGNVLCEIDPGLLVPYPHSPPVRTHGVPPAHWR